MEIIKLGMEHYDDMLPLAQELNPDIEPDVVAQRLKDMINSDYMCFGSYLDGQLAGMCGAWVTVRLYSGKQIELDNAIIRPEYRSKGFGKYFLDFIQKWAVENDCSTIELNSYIVNPRSHKLYFNTGFKIIAFHFQKMVSDIRK